jgi:hypothetical protein
VRRRFGPVQGGVPLTAWGVAVVVLAAVAFVLPAWALYLAVVLPREHVTPNWDVVWVGLDLGLAALAGTALVALYHRSRWTPVLAGALAAALVCDAWFDVLTSTGNDRLFALGLAILIELPVAAVATLIGLRSSSVLRAD